MNVSRAYRRGCLIVGCVVLASALLAPLAARSSGSSRGAASALGSQGAKLGNFQFVERSGRTIREADLDGKVAVVSFIFTRCQLSCPRISSVMKSLQARLEGSPVILISLSVDPEHDTAEVLSEYARRFDADPERWWFLTGDREQIHDLIQQRFKLSVAENPAPDPDGSGEAFSHSDRLALVDRGQVVGLYDSKEPADLDELVRQARRRAKAAWVLALPALNASLNGLCSGLLIVGWLFIRSRRRTARLTATDLNPDHAGHKGSVSRDVRVRAHATAMLLAVAASVIFLTSYLVYHFQVGSVRYQGQGALRLAYFTILTSHTLLATFGAIPLIPWTLFCALRGDFARHRMLAATTFPIWLYVSLTGILIYVFIYHT